MTKLCRDCKWSLAPGTTLVIDLVGGRKATETIKIWTCTRPEIDVVNGETFVTRRGCYDIRVTHSLLCGAEGRWFESKDTAIILASPTYEP